MLSDVCSRRGSPLFSRALPPHPADDEPLPWMNPAHDGLRFFKGDELILDRAAWRLEGSVFYDGSADKHPVPDLRRAAWAAVMVDNDGCEVARLVGPVWASLPQTSQAAEQCGRATVIPFLISPYDLQLFTSP